MYVLTEDGWKSAPMIEYKPPKWHHRVLMWLIGYPLLGVMKGWMYLSKLLNGR